MNEELSNFSAYTPRSANSLLQRKPHIRVETQDNGRTRMMFYASVRDWLGLKYDRKYETYVEMLLNYDDRKIILRGLGLGQDTPTAIPVRGLSNTGYITLANFIRDFPIRSGLYSVKLVEFEGAPAALLDASQEPAK